MNQDDIVVANKNLREPMDKSMEQALREHEAENLRRAEEREEFLLNKPAPIIDAFTKGISNIKKLFAKKKSKEAQLIKSKVQEQQNERKY